MYGAAQMRMIESLQDITARLYDYCAIDCTNPWACEGCGVYAAKHELQGLGVGVHIPELMVTLEPDQEEAVNQPVTLSVLPGGRK